MKLESPEIRRNRFDDETEYARVRIEEQNQLTDTMYESLFADISHDDAERQSWDIFCDDPYLVFQSYEPTEEDIEAMYREWYGADEEEGAEWVRR